MGPGLKTSIWYPGRQTAIATSLGNTLSVPQPTIQGLTLEPLCLRATSDPTMHLTLDAKINGRSATVLVDSGATGTFMHPTFAKECQAIITPKTVPREVRVIDGRVINSGLITHEAEIHLTVNNHYETLKADITNTGRYPCVLGTPWLVRHDPSIRWSTGEVLFDSHYCQHNCL